MRAVRVRVDGGIWFTATGREQWQVRLNTLNYANGVHVLEASVQDDSGAYGNCTVELVIQNRPEPPPTIEAGNPAVLVIGVGTGAAALLLALRFRRKG